MGKGEGKRRDDASITLEEYSVFKAAEPKILEPHLGIKWTIFIKDKLEVVEQKINLN